MPLSNKRKDTLNIVLIVYFSTESLLYNLSYMILQPLPLIAPSVIHSESGMNKTIKLYSFHS